MILSSVPAWSRFEKFFFFFFFFVFFLLLLFFSTTDARAFFYNLHSPTSIIVHGQFRH